MKGSDFYTAPATGYYILNTFTLPVDSVAVGFLVGTLVHSPEAITALANVIGPGMCFLCGVFVPMDLPAENTALSSANRSSVFWSADPQ